MSDQDLKPNYDPPQVLAEAFECGLDVVYRGIRQGRVKAVKVGRLWKIPRPETERCLKEGF